MAIEKGAFVAGRSGTPWEQAKLVSWLLAQPNRTGKMFGNPNPVRAELVVDTTLRNGTKRQRARFVLLQTGNATKLPFADDSFDFVVSLGTLHNLPISQLFDGVKEIERVGKGAKKYIMVESWRNERERMNLMYWQLTCEAFHDVANWEWIYRQCGYQGDWGFIYFE